MLVSGTVAFEFALFLHVPDAAFAVVLDVFGEIDEILDVFLFVAREVSIC